MRKRTMIKRRYIAWSCVAFAAIAQNARAQSDSEIQDELRDDPALSAPSADQPGGDLSLDDASVPLEDEAQKTAKPAASKPAEQDALSKDLDEPPTAAPRAAVAEAPLFDRPNRDMEKRLNKIYKRNSEPMSEERWDQIISQSRSEKYRIRKGNTLSGISGSLFGDPAFWPKLWSENGDVENPHLIVPGKAVRFVAGTEEEAPAVVLEDADRSASELDLPPPSYEVEAEASISPDDAVAPSVLDEAEVERPAIPEAETQAKRKVNRLPPSFVSIVPPSSAAYDRSGLDAPKRRAERSVPQVIPSHYWVESTPDGIGKVAEMESGEEIASIYQTVLVVMDRDPKIGERFSVVSPAGKPGTGSVFSSGRVLEVGGVIEIQARVREQPETKLYRAQVLKSIGPIRKGSLVIAEPLPRADFSRSGKFKRIEARVIGGHYGSDRKNLGLGSVIYLNAGSAQGLAAGDMLGVLSRRESRFENTRFPEVSTPVALAKIVNAQPHGSTAFLIEAVDQVIPGDLTGGPMPRPPSRAYFMQRSRVIDVDYEVARDHERQEAAESARRETDQN